MRYEIGDEVFVKSNNFGKTHEIGKKLKIRECGRVACPGPGGQIYWFEGEACGMAQEDLELIINNNNNMSTIKNTLKDLMRTEPEKTFIKAGFLDNEENITTKGREALEYIIWNNNKDEIKKLADKIIEKDANR